MRLLVLLLTLCCWVLGVAANTEKIIFVAPENTLLSDEGPGLAELRLSVLSPASPTLRTSLPVTSPDRKDTHGLESWYLLHGLQQHQRYEVRICWSATVSRSPRSTVFIHYFCMTQLMYGTATNPL